MLAPWKKSYDQSRQHIKKQRHYFAIKGLSSQSYGFSSNVWMWQLDHKESWAPKNWCSSTVMLEKTLESPLDCKEIQLVNSKGNQSWIFIGRTDAEAERAGSLETAWFWERLEASLTQWVWVWAGFGRWWSTGKPGVLQSLGVTKSWTWLSDWTTTINCFLKIKKCMILIFYNILSLLKSCSFSYC